MKLGYVLAVATGLMLLSSDTVVAQAVKANVAGKVTGVAPGAIAMTAGNGKSYIIAVPADKTVVSITGSLTPAQLGPGMILRFTGAMEGEKMVEEVKQITVYTRNDGYAIGVLQDDASPIPVITGVLSKMKDKTITVSLGRNQLSATLADDVAISVQTGDYSVVPAGAAIKVDGRFVLKNKKPTNKITPKSVKIELPTVP